MKTTIMIDENLQEPEIIIHTREMTPEIQSLLRLLRQPALLRAKDGSGQWTLIEPEKIYRIWSENKQVYLKTEKNVYRISQSISALENQLQMFRFLRISSGELISLSKIQTFDLSILGTIAVRLKNGDVCYVSRRNVSRIKAVLKGVTE